MFRFKVSLVLLLTTFCHFNIVAQMLIQGKVTDDKKKPIALANIYVKGSSIGTVSNEMGEFQIYIQNPNVDTIIVSFVGYERTVVAASNIKEKEELLITLPEDVISLSEIKILSPKIFRNPTEIVERAIKKIESDHSKSLHILRGYFKHTYEQDGKYKKLLEAAITIMDGGNAKTKFNIDELRRSYDFREVYAKSLNRKASAEELAAKEKNSMRLTLECWYRNNFNRKNPEDVNQFGINGCGFYDFGLLNQDFIKEHKFKLDSLMIFEDEYVYSIKILPSRSSKPYSTFPDNLIIPVGRIFIKTDDLSILKMEYSYILNPKKRNSDDYKTTFKVFGTGIIFQITANYKQYDGKMYLSFLNTKDYSGTSLEDRKVRSKNNSKVYNLTQRTLLINEIIFDKNQVNNIVSNMVWDSDLSKLRPYNESFWLKFGTLKETTLQENLRKDLELQSPLETQFKNN